jgi:hypothetical protein
MTWKRPTDSERFTRHRQRNYAFKALAESVAYNRRRKARFDRAERVLWAMRLKIFDYEDADALDGGRRAEKARRVMALCKAILAPLWDQQRRGRDARRLESTPSSFEPGLSG